VLSELHALSRYPVNVRSPDFFLPIAAQLTVPQVIGKDKNDIGFRASLFSTKLEL
jgi:hypothetical protein